MSPHPRREKQCFLAAIRVFIFSAGSFRGHTNLYLALVDLSSFWRSNRFDNQGRSSRLDKEASHRMVAPSSFGALFLTISEWSIYRAVFASEHNWFRR
jgi:hypothetical protein